MKRKEALDLVGCAYAAGHEPRIHPNGFIQLDLDNVGEYRIHVWRNDLPRQKVYTPIHNHRFDFKSITVVGSLLNTTFEEISPESGSPHRLWVVRRSQESEETKLIATDQLVGLLATATLIHNPGDEYEFSAGDFHETGFLHNTVTVIQKTEPVDGIETAVYVPEGTEPDNTFTRALPHSDKIKQKINEALT